MTYSEKLKDPRWQRKRLEIFNRDDWTCQNCKATNKTLVIHHLKYSGNPWEVENEFLKTLCEDCHESSHDEISINAAKEELLFEIKDFKLLTLNSLIGLIKRLKEYNSEKCEGWIFVIWACVFHDKVYFNEWITHYNLNRKDWEKSNEKRGFEV